MHDGAAALLDHAGDQGPVQPDGGEQVALEIREVAVVTQSERTARTPGLATGRGHHDVHTAQDGQARRGELGRAPFAGEVGRHEVDAVRQLGRFRAGSRDDSSTGSGEHAHGCRADSARAAGDDGAAPLERVRSED